MKRIVPSFQSCELCFTLTAYWTIWLHWLQHWWISFRKIWSHYWKVIKVIRSYWNAIIFVISVAVDFLKLVRGFINHLLQEFTITNRASLEQYVALVGCVDRKKYAPSEFRTLGVAVKLAKSGMEREMESFWSFLSKKAQKGRIK